MNKRHILSLSTMLLACLWVSTTNAQEEPLTVAAQATPLSCFGDTNSEFTWEIGGGTPPYNYEWSRLSNPFVFAAGSQPEAGVFGPLTGALSANTYILKITDATGAMVSDTLTLVQPESIQVTAISVEPLSCATICDGRILMEVGGGTGELTVSWGDDPTDSPNRSALCADEYLFFLMDENGCEQKGIIGVEGPMPLAIEATASPTLCQGTASGSMQLEVNGGVGEYAYEWSTGVNVSTLVNAAANDYTVTVTDANNCSMDTVLTIPEGPLLLANPQVGYGCGDGQILVTAQPINGTGPYQYQWSGGQQSSYLYGMSAGEYGLTLTDVNGCQTNENFTIDYVAPLEISATVADVSCFGAQDGAVNLEINGGSPPFALSWNTGASGANVNQLAGGEYTYNLSATGCGQARSVVVYEPAILGAEVFFDLQTDGLITASAVPQGGTPPYQFNWSNGATTETVINLNPELTYQLSITDAANCTHTQEVVPTISGIEQPLEERIMVYPNPHNGYFTLENTSAGTSLSYRIVNASGQLIRDWQVGTHIVNQIDMTAQPRGVYLLQWKSGTQIETIRMVKM